MRNIEDLSGLRFGRLLVLRKNQKLGSRGWSYHCRCSCGKEVSTPVGAKLKKGLTASCGCLRKENVKAGQKHGSKHHAWTGCGGLTGAKWHQITAGAAHRGIPLTITIDQAWQLFQLQQGKCALTGVELRLPLSLKELKTKKQTASLDRIDSSQGYTIDNVQWVHKTVNDMKSSMPQAEFLTWCSAVAGYLGRSSVSKVQPNQPVQ